MKASETLFRCAVATVLIGATALQCAADEAAVGRIKAAIVDSVDLGPTLVIWIVDRTPSAREMVGSVRDAVKELYEASDATASSGPDEKRLLSAVATFDADVQFVLDPPTADSEQVIKSWETIRSLSGGREMTFAAIRKTLERYLPLRTSESREMVVVVVTNEVGDDPDSAEPLLEMTRRHAIPVYVIGAPAPWGQVNPLAKDPKVVGKSGDDSAPTFGPESMLSERVDIDVATAPRGPRIDMKLVDSGFGPFALERLCRASHGQFIAVRPKRGADAKGWPTGKELRFDPSVVHKYAPDYVSLAGYQKLVAESKARVALLEAAKMTTVRLEGTPGSRFPKDAEATMAKKLSQAQQYAARNLPAVERLCEVLLQGEADRAKLTGARWQAQFDLAIGRAFAHKARLDGYNSMLALLKRGKTFQNADSQAWMLEPAESFDTESTIRRTAEKAKMYLDRVAKEHPRTPWAQIAEEELKTPLGWNWTEAK